MKFCKNKINICIYNCIVNNHVYLKINNKFRLVLFNPI